jgi:hypothetical protein
MGRGGEREGGGEGGREGEREGEGDGGRGGGERIIGCSILGIKLLQNLM